MGVSEALPEMSQYILGKISIQFNEDLHLTDLLRFCLNAIYARGCADWSARGRQGPPVSMNSSNKMVIQDGI